MNRQDTTWLKTPGAIIAKLESECQKIDRHIEIFEVENCHGGTFKISFHYALMGEKDGIVIRYFDVPSSENKLCKMAINIASKFS